MQKVCPLVIHRPSPSTDSFSFTGPLLWCVVQVSNGWRICSRERKEKELVRDPERACVCEKLGKRLEHPAPASSLSFLFPPSSSLFHLLLLLLPPSLRSL